MSNRCTSESPVCPASYQFMHSAANGCDTSNRPLVICAANVPKEPDSAILVSCCARTQREECGGCEKFDSTWQRAMRPFMHVAA